MPPEFSRPVKPDDLPHSGRVIEIKANAQERAAVAQRLGLPGIAALTCVFTLQPLPGGAIRAEGRLKAALSQVCVVSLETFPGRIHESFTVRLVPEHKLNPDFDPEDEEDEVPYTDDRADLGEIAVEQLALSLDPYPRKPGAAFDAEYTRAEPAEADHAAPPEDEEGEQDERRKKPFQQLAALRKLKDGG